jgi:hypothetical protein
VVRSTAAQRLARIAGEGHNRPIPACQLARIDRDAPAAMVAASGGLGRQHHAGVWHRRAIEICTSAIPRRLMNQLPAKRPSANENPEADRAS